MAKKKNGIIEEYVSRLLKTAEKELKLDLKDMFKKEKERLETQFEKKFNQLEDKFPIFKDIVDRTKQAVRGKNPTQTKPVVKKPVAKKPAEKKPIFPC